MQLAQKIVKEQIKSMQILAFSMLYILIGLPFIRGVVQVKEIKQKFMSTADEFIQLHECTNSFFVNKIIENEEFLLTSELLTSYEFHKIKDETSNMIMIGDTIAIIDSNYRFLSLQLKYTNSSHPDQRFKFVSRGSYDLKAINETQYRSEVKSSNETIPLFKMFQSSSADEMFIFNEKKLFKIQMNNPLQSLIKGNNHFFYFNDLSSTVDDIVYYPQQGLFFVANAGDVLIYKEQEQADFSLLLIGKVKGLRFDQLKITQLYIYKDILLVVDQENGIFFYGLPNEQSEQNKSYRREVQRLPLQIQASDVVDVKMNEQSVIVVESEDSNSSRVVITEYFYHIEQALVFEVKEILQRYSFYQKGSLTNDKFYFISNFAIHYIYLLQNYSQSNKAVSSIFDPDDFSYTEDKLLTNSMSVRIHNLIVFDSFKEYSQPILIGLESKKINVFGLEMSPPTLEIKYNDGQEDGDDENSQSLDNQDGIYESSTDREQAQNNLKYNTTTNDNDQLQKNRLKNGKQQLITSCAVFNCTAYEQDLQRQMSKGLIQQDSYQITTSSYDEYEIRVFSDFCIITTQIDFIPTLIQSWFDQLINNQYFYYGMASSLALLPLVIKFIRFLLEFKCKYDFNLNISTPYKKNKKAIQQDKVYIMQTYLQQQQITESPM